MVNHQFCTERVLLDLIHCEGSAEARTLFVDDDSLFEHTRFRTPLGEIYSEYTSIYIYAGADRTLVL